MNTLFDLITYTKGIEYLIAVAFLLLFVVFWHLLNTTAAPQPAAVRSPVLQAVRDMVGGFTLPGFARFHPGHAWARDDGGDLVTVGVDDFGQRLVGRVEAVGMPTPGTEVKQGESAWTLQVDGAQIDMLSPVDGKIARINPDVVRQPDLVNQDPFGKGWLMQVRAPRKTANLKGLLSGSLAKHWLEEARGRLMARTEQDLGTVLADAGPSRAGIARIVDEQRWEDVVKDFFLTAGDEKSP